eukprot:2099988-Amphidinium_carterae.1
MCSPPRASSVVTRDILNELDKTLRRSVKQQQRRTKDGPTKDIGRAKDIGRDLVSTRSRMNLHSLSSWGSTRTAPTSENNAAIVEATTQNTVTKTALPCHP